MRRFALLLACVACGPAPAVVSLAPRATQTPVASSPTRLPRAPSTTIVVTGAPYGGLALWRPHANGRIEAIAFPWAKLSIIDSLVVSPDGHDVAYVENGSSFGPLLVRALADGAKTVIAHHASGRELLAVAWSPDGRELLYAERRAGRLSPSSHFVFDRESGKSAPIEVPGELAAWLPSGDLIVADDDGALTRIDHGTKTPVAVGPYRHDDFMLDAAGDRLLSRGWDETTKRDEVLALDLATWKETALAPPATYATYLWPSASPSGKRVAWIATSFAQRSLRKGLVVDGKTLGAPARELVGFTWIDDSALVAHYEDRLDVIDANDGAVRGSAPTNAHDVMR